MSAYTFVLSDESKNSYGFVIQTKGIDLERFKKNPVMYYQHDTKKGIIGRWENIRLDGNRLLADAVFDESEPLGRMVKEKVDNGFLRSVSIGVEPLQKELINSVETVIKCDLVEVSIVEIPSNQNAVKLSHKNSKLLYCLSYSGSNKSSNNDNNIADFRSGVLKLLGLDEKAEDKDILSKIEELLKNTQSIENEIDKSLRLGIITNPEKQMFLRLSKHDASGVLQALDEKRDSERELIYSEIQNACNKGKFLHAERNIFEVVGKELGFKTLQKLIATLPDGIKATDIIKGGKDYNKANWGVMEYRKYAPLELKHNPDLYKRLLEKEGKEVERDLDWYRKNDPDFLRNNPTIYAQLLEKEK